MKNINIVSCVIFVMLLFNVSCASQQSESDKKLKEALPQLDKSAGNYDPSTTVNPEGAHRALTVVVDSSGNYSLDMESINAPIRKGRLPYKIEREEPKKGLPFAVSWYDRSDHHLGSYTIENPVTFRSCEEGKQEIKVIRPANFEILLPANVDIGSVRISNEGKEVTRIQLPPRRQ